MSGFWGAGAPQAAVGISVHCDKSTSRHGFNSDCPGVWCQKLNLVGLTIRMNKNDNANSANLQTAYSSPIQPPIPVETLPVIPSQTGRLFRSKPYQQPRIGLRT
jgi:hypothetical protein